MADNQTSKVFLAAAVGLGLIATVLAFAFIQGAGNADRGPKTYITVAKHDMSPNTPIDPERDLERLEIPEKFKALAARSIDWETRASHKGDRVNRDIFGGQPILVADVAAVGSLKLEKPYVALSLPAEIGMVIPGDYVKIIITRAAVGGNTTNAPGPLDAARLPFDSLIVGKDPGYKVLAVGGYLNKSRAQVLASDQGTSNIKSITLQVTEPQAKEIMGALGSLSGGNKAILLLCPSENTMPPTTNPN